MWSAIIRRTRSISFTSTPGIATGADDLDKVAAGWIAAADVAGATFGLACSEETATDGLLAAGAATADAGFGANTFGCLMDGWIYVGGRYLNWGHSYVWTYDSFHYYPEEDKLSVNVSVKPDINIHFIILSPQEGKEATLTDIRFRGEELEDGTAFISHFDPELNIISATFGNGKRLTNGRFDIHYTTQQQ